MPEHRWPWDSMNTLAAVSILIPGDSLIQQAVLQAVAEGTSLGEGIGHLADRVQRIYPADRDVALRIARNLLGAVMSEDHFLSAKHAGMTHKTWLCSRPPDGQTCQHALVEEAYRLQPFPIDEPFIVNGKKLLFPRDYVSSHGDECMDCQCTMLAARPRRHG